MPNGDLNDICRSLGKLEGKIDGVVIQLGQVISTQAKQDQKIDDLEANQNQMKGKAIAWGGFAGLLMWAIGIAISFFRKNL